MESHAGRSAPVRVTVVTHQSRDASGVSDNHRRNSSTPEKLRYGGGGKAPYRPRTLTPQSACGVKIPARSAPKLRTPLRSYGAGDTPYRRGVVFAVDGIFAFQPKRPRWRRSRKTRAQSRLCGHRAGESREAELSGVTARATLRCRVKRSYGAGDAPYRRGVAGSGTLRLASAGSAYPSTCTATVAAWRRRGRAGSCAGLRAARSRSLGGEGGK